MIRPSGLVLEDLIQLRPFAPPRAPSRTAAGEHISTKGAEGKVSSDRHALAARLFLRAGRIDAMVRAFLHDTRAGATAIVAAGVIIMTMGGFGLLVDHLWLVHKRDLLKAASDSAAVAATLALQQSGASDAELQDIAERHVRFNVLANLRAGRKLEPREIEATLDIDRDAGTVGVTAKAPTGGLLMGFLHDYRGPEDITTASGAEAATRPLALMLAIDVSLSMARDLRGRRVKPSRMSIVKAAAHNLADILEPNPEDPIAIGIVPWGTTVCRPKEACDDGNYPVLRPLSTDRVAVRNAIDQLRSTRSWTYSASGLHAAREELEAAEEEMHRALVLLTDGEDTRDSKGAACGPGRGVPPGPKCLNPRREACAAAKAADIEIFVIAAMAPQHVSGVLGRELRACATTDDASHVFINNATAADLRTAFSTIGGRLKALRKIY